MERHELWKGGPVYGGDAIIADSLALAAFASKHPGERICDLGCGSGILLVLLGWDHPLAAMFGVEIRENAAEECRKNLTDNGFASRSRIICGDFRENTLPAGSMDLVVTNPPYFKASSGRVSPDPDRALMRTETATLTELAAACARLLKDGGEVCLVHLTSRMVEVFEALRSAGLEPKSIRMISPNIRTTSGMFLCCAKKGAHPGLTVEPLLYLRNDDGTESADCKAICHREENK